MKNVTIIGAGLAGALICIYLARRGYNVELYESRADIRLSSVDSGRSINLAMSCRGLTGLKGVGDIAGLHELMVPMRARAIHQANGDIDYQAFGRHADEYINSIDRRGLNQLLLNKAETFPNVRLHFDTKLVALDVVNKQLTIQTDQGPYYHTYQHLIGADGAPSFVREAMSTQQLTQSSRTFLSHGYKELTLAPPGGQTLAPEHLHLWPRNSYLLLGNPNPDGSVTGSLFLANQGPESFESLDSRGKINDFLVDSFPDLKTMIPTIIEEFLSHPVGNMSTVKCTPWFYSDSCLLLGDAAHGVIPFFGQGMNCAFEDCRILNDLLDKNHDDWAMVMPLFYESRYRNTDAVAAMSMDNYHEIYKHISDKRFILKKQIEKEIMKRYSHYVSKHVLVMFSNTPYYEAREIGKLQDDLLNEICASIHNSREITWSKVDGLMKKYDKNLTKIASDLF